MPRVRTVVAPVAERPFEPFVIVTVRVPPDWKRWLEEAAHARGLSVAALIRQCIRALMVTRHENGSSSS